LFAKISLSIRFFFVFFFFNDRLVIETEVGLVSYAFGAISDLIH